jgi:biopolymer transport protein ExbD
MKPIVIALVLLCACKDKPAPEKREAPKPERSKPGARPELTDVTGPGLVPATGLGPKITFTTTEIQLDGETIAPVRQDGWIEPTREQALIALLEAKANSDAPVAVTLAATVPYRRVGQLLDMLKRAGFRNLALLANSGGQMIPIELADAAEINGVGLRPVVTLRHQQLILWSATGQEGTRAKPKLTLAITDDNFERLTRALADIVQKRWPDHKRDDADRTIIIQADGNQPAQVVLKALAAVRIDGSLELFPNIFLAGGG